MRDLLSVIIPGGLAFLFFFVVLRGWNKELEKRQRAAAREHPEIPDLAPRARIALANEWAVKGHVIFRRRPDLTIVVGSGLLGIGVVFSLDCLSCAGGYVGRGVLGLVLIGYAAREIMWLYPRNAIILTDRAFRESRIRILPRSRDWEIPWEMVVAEELVPYGTGPKFLGSSALARFLANRGRMLRIRNMAVRVPGSWSLPAVLVWSARSQRKYRTATIQGYHELRSVLAARARSFDVRYEIPSE